MEDENLIDIVSSCDLRHLSLERCDSLTDIGLSTLSRCRNLETLFVGLTDFDDAALEALTAECSKLRILDLGYNTLVCVTFGYRYLLPCLSKENIPSDLLYFTVCILCNPLCGNASDDQIFDLSLPYSNYRTNARIGQHELLDVQSFFSSFSITVETNHCLQDTLQCVVLLVEPRLCLNFFSLLTRA